MTMPSFTVTVNGQPQHICDAALASLLQQFAFKPPFALAINGQFVPQPQYQDYQLQPGDCVDVLSPISGG